MATLYFKKRSVVYCSTQRLQNLTERKALAHSRTHFMQLLTISSHMLSWQPAIAVNF